MVAPRLPEFKMPDRKPLECPKPTVCPETPVKECPKLDLPPQIGDDIYLSIKGKDIKANKGGEDLIRDYLNTRGDIKKTWYVQ